MKSHGYNGNLYYNGKACNSDLRMNLYGGEKSSFWIGFTVCCEAIGFIFCFYILYLYVKNKPIKQNTIVQAGFVGILTFFMLFAFGKVDDFSDEIDNIVGGMLIRKGYIIHVDFYTQHTPVAYFMCTLFYLLNAGSVEQFRLLYYLVIVLVYMALYVRHKDNLGKVNMFLLPVIQIAFGVLLANESIMILSDNIQAIALTALFLEFLQYLKDEKLDVKRSIIVSMCILFSFGVAFVSVYTIFAIGLGVFIKEITYWKKNKTICFGAIVKRYWKIVIICLIPIMLLLSYFVLTHSLAECYKQAFKFNTEIYSQYIKDGLGSDIFQPFFIGMNNFIGIIPNAISNIVQNQEILLEFAKMLLGVLGITVLVNMIYKKEYLKAVISVLFISFSFTRTNEPFHEMPAWFALITVILVNINFKKIKENNLFLNVVLIAFAVITLSVFFDSWTENLFKKQEPISEIEKLVVDNTEEGEAIFYDIYSYPTAYFTYKNRAPINRLPFILPWWFDWYELDTIEDLTNHNPRLVIYDEDLKAWEISGYDDYLKKYLHENYNPLPETKKIWILK